MNHPDGPVIMMVRLYLPGKVEALPTEIGEPGLGEGGRCDHWTRPGDQNDNGEDWRIKYDS